MTERKKLTLGMATFDDYDGIFFSIKAIQLYHPEILKDIEFLILDNNPAGKHGEAVRRFLREEVRENYKYVPMREVATSFTKYKVFEIANTPYVLCMDCHVLFEKGSLKKLLNYYEKNPKTNDLLQGPLIHNKTYFTHWSDEWFNKQCGTWAKDKRGENPNSKPFEIIAQGMGMLSCRKEAFPKINPLFKGFGGEEKYIQEKFRRKGGKTLCLPFLRWHHRFDDKKPNKITYPIQTRFRLRNNLITHLELGWDLGPLYDNFFLDVKDFNQIYINTVKELRAIGRKDIKVEPKYIQIGKNMARLNKNENYNQNIHGKGKHIKNKSRYMEYTINTIWKISAILKKNSRTYRKFVKLIKNDNSQTKNRK